MQICEEHKMMMGKLFYIYRKQNQFLLKELLYIDDIPICSNSTYQRIENGEVILQDEIYEMLINKFQLKYKKNEQIDEYIKEFEVTFYDACYYHKEEKLNQLYEQFLQILKPYQNYFIYGEYYEMVKDIFEYNINGKYVEQEKYDFYLACAKKKLYSEQLIILLLNFLCANRMNYLGQTSQNVDEELKKIIDNYIQYPSMKYYTYPFLFVKGKYYEALDLLQEAYIQFEQEKNDYWMIKCKIGEFNIFKTFDSAKAFKIIDECKDLFNKDQLPKKLLLSWYYNIAVLYWNIDNYNKCIEFMRMYLKDKEQDCLGAHMFICMSQSRLNMDHYDVDEDILEKYKEDKRTIFLRIFQMRNEQVSDKKIEQYLLKDAQEFLQTIPKEMIYWDVADDEFAKCVKNTRDYGLYFKFKELSAKAVQK